MRSFHKYYWLISIMKNIIKQQIVIISSGECRKTFSFSQINEAKNIFFAQSAKFYVQRVLSSSLLFAKYVC